MRLPCLFVALPCLIVMAANVRAEGPAGVAVLRSGSWSIGDRVREGAGEMEVLLGAAKAQRAASAAGLVIVGDHNGFLRSGGERALRRLALDGLVVVRLAPGGEVASATGDKMSIDGSHLSAAEAARLLARCLEHLGAPPRAADPDHPREVELAAVRAHLAKFRAAFAAEARSLVAAR